MTEELDITLAQSGSILKKGYSFVIANIGKTVAIITLLVTALVSFTEISLSELNSEVFTSTLIMMLLASYVMYFSLEDAGERLARENESYKEISERHESLEKDVKRCDIARLREFCLDYTKAELEYRRSNMLFSLGYTKEEYDAYLNGAKIPKKTAKALRRVEKIKRAQLSASTLLSAKSRTKSELKNPEVSRLTNMIIRLIPSTVCMLFTVSVMVSVKDNMTVAGVIEAILKLSTLPIIGLKGYSDGYEYVMNNESAWLETKSRLIEAFLKDNKPPTQ
jgi:translation elongation factor EF-G